MAFPTEVNMSYQQQKKAIVLMEKIISAMHGVGGRKGRGGATALAERLGISSPALHQLMGAYKLNKAGSLSVKEVTVKKGQVIKTTKSTWCGPIPEWHIKTLVELCYELGITFKGKDVTPLDFRPDLDEVEFCLGLTSNSRRKVGSWRSEV